MFEFSLSGYLVWICQQLLITVLIPQVASVNTEHFSKVTYQTKNKNNKCVIRDNSHELRLTE